MRATRGAAMPMLAAGMIPMIGAVGSGIDLGRIYVAKSQMQAGVDAAALAGARSFGVTDGSANDRDKQVQAYFYGNFPNGYMGMPAVTPVPKFTVENGINQTVVTASGRLPMTFMAIFGVGPQTITAIARAQLQPRPLEVMVVLDNTGSMNGILDGSNTSMDALKISMHNFISTLYQGAATRASLAMGIINYTITTNVGDILKKFGVPTQMMPYFNDPSLQAKYGFSWPSQPLLWKGCVADDPTHTDMSSNLATAESDAYDIQRTLPNDGTGMPAIRPFFYPPTYTPQAKNVSAMATTTSDFYKVRTSGAQIESSNNLYLLDPFGSGDYGDNSVFSTLANSETYKPYFYKLYIGLNNSSNTGDDVVVRKSDEGYLDPATISDPKTAAAMDKYKIKTSRIPNLPNALDGSGKPVAQWQAPTSAEVFATKTGKAYKNAGNKNLYDETPHPSPNWQCPNGGMEVKYGRNKSDYDNFIDTQVAPIQMANGTEHHIGFLWGYRLLVRDKIFTRSNPTTEQPNRALIFMTDGVSAFNQPDDSVDSAADKSVFYDRNYTAYGTVADNNLLSAKYDKAKFQTAVELRFRKTCEAAKAETNPPKIYIVALNRGGGDMDSNTRAMFKACATGGYYETTSTNALNAAFTEIATELVDLHLTQ